MSAAGEQLVRHLVVAVRAHVAQLHRDGRAVPAGLADLAAFLATAGQTRPTLDAWPSGVDSAAMVPLTVDFRSAGELLGVSERTARRLVRGGDLPAVEIAGCRRIRTADLVEYVAHLTPTSRETA